MHEHTEFSVLNSTSILWECAFVGGCKRILCVQVNACELVQLHIFSRIFFLVFVLLSSLFVLLVFFFHGTLCVCAQNKFTSFYSIIFRCSLLIFHHTQIE